MDKNKKMALCFFMAAICSYIAAAIIFLNRSSSNTTGIVFICVGSTWVAIGGSFSNKDKNKDDDNSSSNKEE